MTAYCWGQTAASNYNLYADGSLTTREDCVLKFAGDCHLENSGLGHAGSFTVVVGVCIISLILELVLALNLEEPWNMKIKTKLGNKKDTVSHMQHVY